MARVYHTGTHDTRSCTRRGHVLLPTVSLDPTRHQSLPHPQPQPGSLAGPVQLRLGPGPRLRADRRGLGPGQVAGPSHQHRTPTPPRVVSGGRRQGRQPPPRHRPGGLLRTAVGLGPGHLDLATLGLGPGRDLPGRSLYRPGGGRRLPRLRRPRRLGGPRGAAAGQLAALLAGPAGGPGHWTVTVLSDRGLESAGLFVGITALGWHPLMRVKQAGQFRPDGWHPFWPMRRLVPQVGRRWKGRGQAYKSLQRPLRCTLLARWEPGHEEPWLVLTELGPQDADAAWYGWRCWIEQSFKVAKRGGWQWQRTRMTDGERASRLWVVLALATLWLLEVGGMGAEVAAETFAAVDAVAGVVRACRLHSVFREGLYTLLAALWRGE